MRWPACWAESAFRSAAKARERLFLRRKECARPARRAARKVIRWPEARKCWSPAMSVAWLTCSGGTSLRTRPRVRGRKIQRISNSQEEKYVARGEYSFLGHCWVGPCGHHVGVRHVCPVVSQGRTTRSAGGLRLPRHAHCHRERHRHPAPE